MADPWRSGKQKLKSAVQAVQRLGSTSDPDERPRFGLPGSAGSKPAASAGAASYADGPPVLATPQGDDAVLRTSFGAFFGRSLDDAVQHDAEASAQLMQHTATALMQDDVEAAESEADRWAAKVRAPWVGPDPLAAALPAAASAALGHLLASSQLPTFVLATVGAADVQAMLQVMEAASKSSGIDATDVALQVVMAPWTVTTMLGGAVLLGANKVGTSVAGGMVAGAGLLASSVKKGGGFVFSAVSEGLAVLSTGTGSSKSGHASSAAAETTPAAATWLPERESARGFELEDQGWLRSTPASAGLTPAAAPAAPRAARPPPAPGRAEPSAPARSWAMLPTAELLADRLCLTVLSAFAWRDEARLALVQLLPPAAEGSDLPGSAWPPVRFSAAQALPAWPFAEGKMLLPASGDHTTPRLSRGWTALRIARLYKHAILRTRAQRANLERLAKQREFPSDSARERWLESADAVLARGQAMLVETLRHIGPTAVQAVLRRRGRAAADRTTAAAAQGTAATLGAAPTPGAACCLPFGRRAAAPPRPAQAAGPAPAPAPARVVTPTKLPAALAWLQNPDLLLEDSPAARERDLREHASTLGEAAALSEPEYCNEQASDEEPGERDGVGLGHSLSGTARLGPGAAELLRLPPPPPELDSAAVLPLVVRSLLQASAVAGSVIAVQAAGNSIEPMTGQQSGKANIGLVLPLDCPPADVTASAMSDAQSIARAAAQAAVTASITAGSSDAVLCPTSGMPPPPAALDVRWSHMLPWGLSPAAAAALREYCVTAQVSAPHRHAAVLLAMATHMAGALAERRVVVREAAGKFPEPGADGWVCVARVPPVTSVNKASLHTLQATLPYLPSAWGHMLSTTAALPPQWDSALCFEGGLQSPVPSTIALIATLALTLDELAALHQAVQREQVRTSQGSASVDSDDSDVDDSPGQDTLPSGRLPAMPQADIDAATRALSTVIAAASSAVAMHEQYFPTMSPSCQPLLCAGLRALIDWRNQDVGAEDARHATHILRTALNSATRGVDCSLDLVLEIWKMAWQLWTELAPPSSVKHQLRDLAHLVRNSARSSGSVAAAALQRLLDTAPDHAPWPIPLVRTLTVRTRVRYLQLRRAVQFADTQTDSFMSPGAGFANVERSAAAVQAALLTGSASAGPGMASGYSSIRWSSLAPPFKPILQLRGPARFLVSPTKVLGAEQEPFVAEVPRGEQWLSAVWMPASDSEGVALHAGGLSAAEGGIEHNAVVHALDGLPLSAIPTAARAELVNVMLQTGAGAAARAAELTREALHDESAGSPEAQAWLAMANAGFPCMAQPVSVLVVTAGNDEDEPATPMSEVPSALLVTAQLGKGMVDMARLTSSAARRVRAAGVHAALRFVRADGRVSEEQDMLWPVMGPRFQWRQRAVSLHIPADAIHKPSSSSSLSVVLELALYKAKDTGIAPVNPGTVMTAATRATARRKSVAAIRAAASSIADVDLLASAQICVELPKAAGSRPIALPPGSLPLFAPGPVTDPTLASALAALEVRMWASPSHVKGTGDGVMRIARRSSISSSVRSASAGSDVDSESDDAGSDGTAGPSQSAGPGAAQQVLGSVLAATTTQDSRFGAMLQEPMEVALLACMPWVAHALQSAAVSSALGVHDTGAQAASAEESQANDMETVLAPLQLRALLDAADAAISGSDSPSTDERDKLHMSTPRAIREMLGADAWGLRSSLHWRQVTAWLHLRAVSATALHSAVERSALSPHKLAKAQAEAVRRTVLLTAGELTACALAAVGDPASDAALAAAAQVWAGIARARGSKADYGADIASSTVACSLYALLAYDLRRGMAPHGGNLAASHVQAILAPGALLDKVRDLHVRLSTLPGPPALDTAEYVAAALATGGGMLGERQLISQPQAALLLASGSAAKQAVPQSRTDVLEALRNGVRAGLLSPATLLGTWGGPDERGFVPEAALVATARARVKFNGLPASAGTGAAQATEYGGCAAFPFMSLVAASMPHGRAWASVLRDRIVQELLPNIMAQEDWMPLSPQTGAWHSKTAGLLGWVLADRVLKELHRLPIVLQELQRSRWAQWLIVAPVAAYAREQLHSVHAALQPSAAKKPIIGKAAAVPGSSLARHLAQLTSGDPTAVQAAAGAAMRCNNALASARLLVALLDAFNAACDHWGDEGAGLRTKWWELSSWPSEARAARAATRTLLAHAQSWQSPKVSAGTASPLFTHGMHSSMDLNVCEARVLVQRAKGMPLLDGGGLLPPDCYVVACLQGDADTTIVYDSAKTRIVGNSTSPEWNELLVLTMPGGSAAMRLVVLDNDGPDAVDDDVVGSVTVPCNVLLNAGQHAFTCNLKDVGPPSTVNNAQARLDAAAGGARPGVDDVLVLKDEEGLCDALDAAESRVPLGRVLGSHYARELPVDQVLGKNAEALAQSLRMRTMPLPPAAQAITRASAARGTGTGAAVDAAHARAEATNAAKKWHKARKTARGSLQFALEYNEVDLVHRALVDMDGQLVGALMTLVTSMMPPIRLLLLDAVFDAKPETREKLEDQLVCVLQPLCAALAPTLRCAMLLLVWNAIAGELLHLLLPCAPVDAPLASVLPPAERAALAAAIDRRTGAGQAAADLHAKQLQKQQGGSKGFLGGLFSRTTRTVAAGRSLPWLTAGQIREVKDVYHAVLQMIMMDGEGVPLEAANSAAAPLPAVLRLLDESVDDAAVELSKLAATASTAASDGECASADLWRERDTGLAVKHAAGVLRWHAEVAQDEGAQLQWESAQRVASVLNLSL